MDNEFQSCFFYSCVLGILPFKEASDLILQNEI
jgi:hypothetical protein